MTHKLEYQIFMTHGCELHCDNKFDFKNLCDMFKILNNIGRSLYSVGALWGCPQRGCNPGLPEAEWSNLRW
jgi:hypothetical protein